MTYDEIIADLRYEVARQQLGTMNDDRVVELVDKLMNVGVYYDEFLGVLDHSPYRPEFVTHVSKAMKKLGIRVPTTRDDAVWYLLKRHVGDMAADATDPLVSLHRLIADVYWDYDFGKLTTNYLGDSHGIEDLIGLYWEYDIEIWQSAPGAPPADVTENYKMSARAMAKAWLQNVKSGE